MKVHVIGAGWSIPQENRSKTSILLRNDKAVLFDCGSDVAKALNRFGLSYDELDAIFISHRHLDHMDGICSLLHATWLSGREKTLPIYSNQDTKNLLEKLFKLHSLDEKLDIDLRGIKGRGKVNEFDVKYQEVDHQVPTHGFRYKDITYLGDTSPKQELIKFGENSRLLLHEATYPSGKEKEAHKYGHSTVKDAVDVFKESGSDNLGILHTSPKVNFKEETRNLDEDVLFLSDFTTLKFN